MRNAVRRTLPVSLRSLALLLMCPVALAGAPLQAQEDPRAFAGALLGQGGKAYEAGQYDRALTLFQRSLDLFQRLDDRQGVRAGLTNLGLVHRALGQDKRALEYYNRALDLVEEWDKGISALLGNTASLALKLGQPDVAIRHYTKCLERGRRGHRQAHGELLSGS